MRWNLGVVSLALLSLPGFLNNALRAQHLPVDPGSAIAKRNVHGLGPRIKTGLNLELPGKDLGKKALHFVTQHRADLLPGDATSEIRMVRQVRLLKGTIVQFEQRVAEWRVLGSSLGLSFDQNQRLQSSIDGLLRIDRLEVLDECAAPGLALDLARRAFEQDGRRIRGEPSVETIWIASRTHLQKAQLVVIPGALPLGEFNYLIAGNPGFIAHVFQRLPMVQGYAYDVSPLHDTYQAMDLLYLTSAQHLTGQWSEVYNCAGSATGTCTPQQLAVPDANGDYLIEPKGANDPKLPTDQFGEVQAYYGINKIHDYFAGIGATPTFLYVGVNFPMTDDMGPNAYYSDAESSFQNKPAIMMGQWRDIDLAEDNSVIFHEYGHHVFGQVSASSMLDMDEYGFVAWGMTFSEAAGDYFSCSALDDPKIGQYFASLLPQVLPNGYLRALDNNLTCPEGLYGEPHADSMIWSGFAWEVRQNIGKELADPLFLDAITHFPSKIDFPTATRIYMERAALVLDAATLEQVRTIAQTRGIGDCQRFLPIVTDGHTGLVMGKALLGSMGNWLQFIPAILHYQIDLPANADRLEIQWVTQPTPNLNVVMLVRADQPVTHELTFTGLVSQYDFILQQGGTFDLLHPTQQAPFTPGHRYYFQPANRDQPNTEYVISGSFTTANTEPEPQVEPDAGMDGGSEDTAKDGGDALDAEDAGDQGCAAGYQAVQDQGQWICVPECHQGFAPQHRPEGWVCVEKGSGCGCAVNDGPAGGFLLLVLWLLLGLCCRHKGATS